MNKWQIHDQLHMLRQKIYRDRGFSLIELITVMVLLGIMSVYALGKLSGSGPLEARVYYDELKAATGFAQKLALSTGCPVRVNYSGGYALHQSSTCTANDFTLAVKNPANRSQDYRNLSLPDGYSLSTASSLVFNNRGMLDSGVDIDVSLSDGTTTYSFKVDAQTGLVWN